MKNRPDLCWLYEAAVQNVDTDLDFAKRVFSRHWKRQPVTLREDFCGTAKLACRWVERGINHEAWGIDKHQPTLNWAIRHNTSGLSEKQKKRLHLVCDDVLTVDTPPIDVVMALNFSFCVFKERELLRRYFRRVEQTLKPEGLFVMDIYGGTESFMKKSDDPRIIPGFTTPNGQEIPDFEYVWEQAEFNPINHHTKCHIHFKVPGVGEIKKAFTYNWRLWTLPELQEILIEAGFSKTEVYLHGFDENGESDEIYRRRTNYENCEAWVAYVVGIK